MANKKSNTGLRMIMATASILGFLGGWVMLGHAPKPGLPTTPTYVNVSASGGTSLIQLPAQSTGAATGLRLRTRGS